jgi:preprotein translocase subunit SecG
MQMSIVMVFGGGGVKFHYLVIKKTKKGLQRSKWIFLNFFTIITIFVSRMFSRSQNSKPHVEPHPFENVFALITDNHHL